MIVNEKKKSPVFHHMMDFWNIITIISLIILTITLLYPFSSLILKSFIDKTGESFTVKNYINFFKLPDYFSTLKHSLVVCLLSTFFATLVGLPMAYISTRFNIYGKKF